jgi:chromosome segregation ATPase
MIIKTIQRLSLLALLTVLFAGAAAPQTQKAIAEETAKDSSAAGSTPLIQATREFMAQTEELAQMQSNEILGAELKVGQLRQLVAEGLVSRAELQASEESLTALRTKLAATRQQVSNAEQKIVEIRAAEELTKTQLAATRINAQAAAKSQSFLKPTMMRYSGASSWALTNLASVQSFFSAKFGRSLPTSAVGQSATHNQLGYDHRNAVDVALHPDSLEGQALINYLRSQGIPFLAFRGAVPGVATGAHIHIGSPSHRLS